MLAVVVLLPILIMISACLLERFEAHATRVRSVPVLRPAVERAPGAPAPAEPAPPALSLVPGTDRERAPRAGSSTTLDADTLRLSRAS